MPISSKFAFSRSCCASAAASSCSGVRVVSAVAACSVTSTVSAIDPAGATWRYVFGAPSCKTANSSAVSSCPSLTVALPPAVVSIFCEAASSVASLLIACARASSLFTCASSAASCPRTRVAAFLAISLARALPVLAAFSNAAKSLRNFSIWRSIKALLPLGMGRPLACACSFSVNLTRSSGCSGKTNSIWPSAASCGVAIDPPCASNSATRSL